MHEQSQYAAAAHIPLIKSPSLRVPRPVELPLDIHPLPESVTPYFAYPFTLEPHIITLESSRRSTIAAHNARREAYMKAREDDKERQKRDALRKIAPGFEPHGSLLVPTKANTPMVNPPDIRRPEGVGQPSTEVKSALDNWVDQLAALDHTTSQQKA